MNLRQSASIDFLNTHSANTAAQNVGIHVEGIGEDWVEASMPFDARTRSTDGSLRLGALTILAESVGSLAAAISVDRARFIAVGQSIQVNHLNAATAGPVRARATPIFVEAADRQIWRIAIADAKGVRIADARLTMAILPAQ